MTKLGSGFKMTVLEAPGVLGAHIWRLLTLSGPHFLFCFFFEIEKNYYFFGVEIFFGYSFEVKFSDLSIYDVFRAFGVRQV